MHMEHLSRVLLVEDDEEIVAWLQRLLAADGFTITSARSLASATALLGTANFGLAIVDLQLPDGRSVSMLPALRQRHPEASILMFSAQEHDDDIVEALEAGADDYVIKPVSPAVLRARVAALQRRATGSASQLTPHMIGDVACHDEGKRIAGPLGSANLTPKECQLFQILATRPGQSIPRREVLAAVWGYEFDPQTSVLDVALSRLRRKLAQVSHHVTVHGQRDPGIRIDDRLSMLGAASSTPSSP
jgi:two-component system, OmpR family, response regulator